MFRGACVVGLSKSGTTGLFSAIHAAFSKHYEEFYALHEKYGIRQYQSLNWYCPDIPLLAKPLLTRDDGFSYEVVRRFENRFLIVRDPRDRMISTILDFPRLNAGRREPEPVERYLDLIRAKERDPASHDVTDLFAAGWEFARGTPMPEGVLANQAARVLKFDGCVPSTRVRYEDMVAGDLSVVAEQLNLDVRPAEPVKSQELVLRSGAAGSWRAWFTERDVKRLRPLLAPVLAALGYNDDWALDARPLNPALGSEHVAAAYARQRAHKDVLVNKKVPVDRDEREAWLVALRSRADDGDAGAATRLAAHLVGSPRDRRFDSEASRLALFAARSGHLRGMTLAARLQRMGTLDDEVDWQREQLVMSQGKAQPTRRDRN